ncbi:MAG: Ig-like domain repeat protein [Proteobacteria bacterium]|nr:Ig-like domain repeat protein [Pseudomonadota bacterium]
MYSDNNRRRPCRTALFTALTGVIAAAIAGGASASQGAAGTSGQAHALPLTFERNVGQAAAGTEYLAHGRNYAITLGAAGATLALPATTAAPPLIDLKLAGARRATAPQAQDPLPGRINYLIGNDPTHWVTDVHTYARVRYPQVYRGVDLVYYGTEGQLEYDFVVAPHTATRDIGLQVDGAENVSLDAHGTLHIGRAGSEVTFRRPVAYQLVDGERREISARYRLEGHAVHFQVGHYDHGRTLVIDPVLSYFSYLGGSGADVIGRTSPQASQIAGQAAALDSAGEFIVTGATASLNFPTHAAYQGSGPAKTYGTSWAFVTKFSADGTSVVYSTYLGGTNGNDLGYGVAVDASGNTFVTGVAGSNDFPATSGAYQTICSPNYNNASQTAKASCGDGGAPSAFVTKLSPSGSLLASTFLGSTYGSYGYGVAVDKSGRPYVAGAAYPGENIPTGVGGEAPAIGFPTTSGAIVTAYNYSPTQAINGALQYDAFVSVFDVNLTTLQYSTLFGDDRPFSQIAAQGSQASTYGNAVTVDASGNFYITGYTGDSFLPTTSGSLQSSSTQCGPNGTGSLALGGNCGFVAKFSPVGSTTLTYGTYLGGVEPGAGSWQNLATGIVADASGNAYVTGFSNDAGFPTTAGSYQPTCDGYNKSTKTGDSQCGVIFIAKLNPSGTSLLAGTFFGCLTCSGDGVSTPGAIALDAQGNLWVNGFGGNGIPVVNGIASTNTTGGQGPFVAEFDSGLATLKFSSFVNVGNAGQISTGGVAVDSSGAVYVAGNLGTPASSGATKGAFQTGYGGGSSDGFVAKIIVTEATKTLLTVSPTSATTGTPVTFTATVSETGGSAVPTGSVTFANGGSSLGKVSLNSSGVATLTTSSLAAGSYSVTAAYGGDTNNSASTSSAVTLTITSAPAPVVSLSVAPTSITLGQSAKLTWSATNATGCTASNAWTGSEPVTGTSTVTPKAAGGLTYTLTCTGTGGSTSKSVMLTVTAPAPTVSLAVAPAAITLGGSATLTWSSTNATACTASGAWSGSEAVNGSSSVTPKTTGTQTYTLTCTGAGGSVAKSASLTVAAVNATPTVTIAVSPASITVGQSAQVTWSSTSATACTASGAWSGSEATSGASTVAPTAAGTLTYTLTCTGTGGSAAKSATLSVAVAPPSVALSVSPASITEGQSATLTWSSTGATSCTASGAWSGSEATSGTSTQTPATSGTLTYSLSCTGAGGTKSQSASLSVAAKSGGGGGGSFDSALLLGLALLAIGRLSREPRLARRPT